MGLFDSFKIKKREKINQQVTSTQKQVFAFGYEDGKANRKPDELFLQKASQESKSLYSQGYAMGKK